MRHVRHRRTRIKYRSKRRLARFFDDQLADKFCKSLLAEFFLYLRQRQLFALIEQAFIDAVLLENSERLVCIRKGAGTASGYRLPAGDITPGKALAERIFL